MVLHCDTLNKAIKDHKDHKDHKGFVIWCQENLIIKK